MTELLEKAVSVVRKMTEAEQDAIAEAMLSLADSDETSDIEPEHLAAVLEGLAQVEKGEFVSDEEVAAVFRRFNE